ncbi:hypothetical protein Tco_1210254 [Tanacetum coccineum]
MSTHKQQTSTIPTSVVRNTGGKSGPQNLKEPASNEALRELRNPRNHEESRYSESKTPPAQTEPERRHGRKHSRSPSLVASVFRRLKQNRSPLPGLRPWKEGGVFTRLGRKEPGAYTRSDSHHQSFQTKGAEAPPRKHHHEGTSSRTGYYWPTMHMDASNNSRSKKAKLKWKSITTLGFAAQVSSQATWFTAATMQVMPGMEENLDPNGKGRTKLQNRLEKGAYKLKDYKGTELPWTWNIYNLKKCYIHEM